MLLEIKIGWRRDCAFKALVAYNNATSSASTSVIDTDNRLCTQFFDEIYFQII